MVNGKKSGFKTFTCSVCGMEVTKPKSYVLPDGKRACREHQEAKQAFLDRDAANRAQLQRLSVMRDQSRLKKEFASSHLHLRCFICGIAGVDQQSYFTRVILENLKYEITTGHLPNPFNFEEMRAALVALKDVVCLWHCRFDPRMGVNNVRFLSSLAFTAADLAGCFTACPHCIQKHLLKTMSQENEAKQTTDEFWENMLRVTAVYEVVVKPVLWEVAKAEMIRGK